MQASDWTNQAVYDLLRKIDRGYQPDEEERAMLETREELKLWYKRLSYVPHSIKLLRSLRLLDLRDNQISGLPDSIGDLPALTELNLKFTQIERLPEGIGALGSLQSLSLAYTPITALPESVGQLASLQRLDLGGTRITALPESVWQLKNLQVLNLYGTQITALPESVWQLTSLQALGLSNTRITALPESIGQLASLQRLYLGGTPITALPESVGQLASLQELNLSGTRITALPESVGQLASLQRLYLSDSPITALPESVGQLASLQALYLRGTRITALPDSVGQLTSLQELYLSNTRITALPEWIGALPALRQLDLTGLTLPELPRALALRGLPFTDTDGLYQLDSGVNLRHVTLTEQDISIFLEHPELIPSLYEDQIHVPECRVLFLGDGDSGKTYTIRRIQNGGKKETAEHPYPTKETPGVEIADWHAERGEDSFDIHFWDFGGQELLHSMHRCFLTDQTCYVVTVKSRETKGTQRARYWLRNVTAFAPTSPILLYVNCWDNDDGRRAIDEPRLRKDYPNIVDVVYVSAKEAEDAVFAEKLMRPLIDMAASSEALNRTVNSRWLAVRQAIARENTAGKGNRRHYLTKDQYHTICQRAGVEDDSAPALLSYFNTLGVCFSYHRDADNNELGNYKLLNPVWLTNAVYAVIEEGMVQAQEGRIKLDAIRQLLGNPPPDQLVVKASEGEEITKPPRRRTMPEYVYSRDECRWVVDVAAAHNLCYEVDKDTLFFPALCTNNTPEEALGDQEGFPNRAEYRFRYDYLPDSVLHRLMIRCLKKGLSLRSCWLRGMTLNILDTHRAIVRMDDDENLKVEIWYKDDRAAFEVFPMLRNEVLAVNESLNLKAKELIADGRDSFPLVQLVQAHKNRSDACWGNETGEEFSVKELLSRFFDTAAVDCLDIDKEGRLVIGPYPYHRRNKNDPTLRRAVWEAYGKKCQYCNVPLSYDELQVDHILATNHLKSRDNRTDLYLAELAQRGFDQKKPDYIENYFPSCGKCNRGKSNVTRDAVTLREYHAIARDNLDKVLALEAKYKGAFRRSPEEFDDNAL